MRMESTRKSEYQRNDEDWDRQPFCNEESSSQVRNGVVGFGLEIENECWQAQRENCTPQLCLHITIPMHADAFSGSWSNP